VYYSATFLIPHSTFHIAHRVILSEAKRVEGSPGQRQQPLGDSSTSPVCELVTLRMTHSSLHIPHSTFHIPHSSFLIPHFSFHFPHCSSCHPERAERVEGSPIQRHRTPRGFLDYARNDTQNLFPVAYATIVGLSMMCYRFGKARSTCFGDCQLRGRMGKAL